MRRFFVDQHAISANQAILTEKESRHITTVLRMQAGDIVELFDESGTVYTGTINITSHQSVTVQILSRQPAIDPISPHLSLYQSMLKGKKMDFLVQKCTELGVHSFHPVLTKFSENRGNLERQNSRWQRIMLEACKQCKRPHPMKIHSSIPLRTIDFSPFSTKLLFWENEETCALQQQHVSGNDTIGVLLGPEGGFHSDEIEWAARQGFQTVSLGSRVLRAETASLSVIAIIQYLCGTLSPEPESS